MTTPNTMIETIARAMPDPRLPPVPTEWFEEDAERIITALEASGYAIVPIEPTEDMCELGWMQMPDSIADAYRAMIQAGRITA